MRFGRAPRHWTVTDVVCAEPERRASVASGRSPRQGKTARLLFGALDRLRGTTSAFVIASLVLVTAGCTPPSGGWGRYSNANPYDLPSNRGGYTPG